MTVRVWRRGEGAGSAIESAASYTLIDDIKDTGVSRAASDGVRCFHYIRLHLDYTVKRFERTSVLGYIPANVGRSRLSSKQLYPLP